MTIPDFTSTQEALAFGKEATPEQIDELYAMRIMYINQARYEMSTGTMEGLDKSGVLATKGQYAKEALESAGQDCSNI